MFGTTVPAPSTLAWTLIRGFSSMYSCSQHFMISLICVLLVCSLDSVLNLLISGLGLVVILLCHSIRRWSQFLSQMRQFVSSSLHCSIASPVRGWGLAKVLCLSRLCLSGMSVGNVWGKDTVRFGSRWPITDIASVGVGEPILTETLPYLSVAITSNLGWLMAFILKKKIRYDTMSLSLFGRCINLLSQFLP